ncbi:hypothetical protein D3C84_1114720 [compost metagenome]
MTLPGGLAAQTQLQGKAGQTITRDGLEVMQASGEGADAVEAGGAEHEAAQRIVITNQHIQPTIGFAGTAFGQRAGIW